MTQKQIEQYEIRYQLDNWICKGCYEKATQIAHRIAQSKVNRKKYGNEIIDHNINLVSSCQECNDSFNIGMNPGKTERLVEFIKENKDKLITSREIQRITDE
jgi:hypothetical protein